MNNTLKKIHVLHSMHFSPNENAFLAPLHRFQKQLKQRGVELQFFNTINDALLDCDFLLLSSKFFGPWWRRYGFEKIQSFLLKAKSKAAHIFWFDLSDSTGTTHFKVLPYVNKYFKNQILKDKTQYQQKYYGMRMATDYYHHQFNIEDDILDEPHLNVLPSNEELEKVHVGWNSGMAYYGRWRHYVDPITRKKPNFYKRFNPKFYSPHITRNIPCSGRFGCSYQRNSVSFPRRHIKEKLQNDIAMEKVNMRRYFKEMQRSIACLSPFGLGEISLRDFEIVLSGAAMMKQNMDHLDTWPNLWEKNKTYLDFSWDFADLKQKMEYIKEHPKEVKQLAETAQESYRHALLKSEGSGSFVERFLSFIE